MEKILFKSKNPKSGKKTIVEALHKKSLSDRKGYDPNFLGINVPLPILSNQVTDQVAKQKKGGVNGKNYLDYTNFSVMFNKDRKLPFFSVVNIVGETNELAGIHDSRQSDSWFTDDRIVIGTDNFQFSDKDYLHSGFQKGHMTRYYDPAWGMVKKNRKIAMGDTFYYTNCCPQKGNYNAGIWNDLEDYYMARAIFQDNKISVFTGPVFRQAVQVGKLLVPLHFWKIIVYRIKDKLEAIAFLISHKFDDKKVRIPSSDFEAKTTKIVKPTLDKADIDCLFNAKNLKKWVVKIELIEEKTGIIFGLNDIDVNRAENKYFNVDVNKLDTDIAKMRVVMTNTKLTGLPILDSDTNFIKNI